MRLRIDERLDPVEERRLEFRQRSAFEKDFDDRVLTAQLKKYRRVGRETAFGSLDGLEFQSIEQHVGQLFGRIDIELLIGELENFLFEGGDPFRHLLSFAIEPLNVDVDAAIFHVGEHLDQRQFDPIVELDQILRAEPLEHADADGGERRAQSCDATAGLEQIIHQLDVVELV